jgi:hypothetical protein
MFTVLLLSYGAGWKDLRPRYISPRRPVVRGHRCRFAER